MGEEFDVRVRGGRLHARRFGPPGRRLVIGIPGLTANLVSMERLAEGVPMVALDLRGRGQSEVTEPGTYGWENHARDVLEFARELGAPRFSIVGWSMGALVGMQAANLAPGRIERLVLIDALGPVPPATARAFEASVGRLGTVHPSVEAYVEGVKGLGLIDPWDEMWERYFRYELREVEGGVTARTSRQAAEEDMAWERAHDAAALWPGLTMRVLLVRAARPLLPGTETHVVTPESVERFRRERPDAEIVEVDANHYGIGIHPDTIAAIRRFFA